MNTKTTTATLAANNITENDEKLKKARFTKSMIIIGCVVAVVLVWKFYFM